MIKGFLVLLVFVSMSGCCTLAKRSCFAPCPPPRVVTVNKCTLPGKITLPAARTTLNGCPSELVCYDEENAKNLFRREDILKQWVKEARTRNEGTEEAEEPITPVGNGND